MAKNIPDHIRPLFAANANIVVKYGDPAVGKTCFLITLYEYLSLSEEWMVEHNVEGNFAKIKRVHSYLDELKRLGQLPYSTTAGEIHELDLLITPDGSHASSERKAKSKLFTVLDLSGEDCLHFKENGTIKGPIKDYLISSLDTTFLYLLKFEEGKDKDLEVCLIIDLLRSAKSHHFDRFALVVTHWDKNIDGKGAKIYPSIGRYMKDNMPRTYQKMRYSEKYKLDCQAFPFSIGQITQDNHGKNVLDGEMDLTYCKEIAHWIYDNKKIHIPWLKNGYATEFASRFGKIFSFILALFSINPQS